MGKLTAAENSTHGEIENERNPQVNSASQRLRGKRDLILWRYDKEIELTSKGANQAEIAEILKLNKSTISKDFKKLRKRAAQGTKDYVEKVLSFEVQKTAVGINEAIRQAWTFALDKGIEPGKRIQALSIIPDAHMKRLAVLGDPAQLEAAIKTITSIKSKIGKQQEDTESDAETSEGSEGAALATKEGELG